MPVDAQHPHFEGISGKDRAYSPDILPRLQSLLAILADIDVAYEKKIASIERSSRDEILKCRMITGLWQSHQKRRILYVAELEEIQEQIRAAFD